MTEGHANKATAVLEGVQNILILLSATSDPTWTLTGLS